MKKTFLILASLLIAVGTFAEDRPASSTHPPRNLKKVGDHWTPWEAPAAGPNDYVIQKGDTLWDLGQQWLGNPFLWPQIWDQNRYIQDSHWIYPGDPLVRPGQPTVVPPSGPPPGEVSEEMPPPAPSPAPAPRASRPSMPAAKALIPLAREHDVYCSEYIEAEHKFSPVWVAGREMEREGVGTGDVVYLSQGRKNGIEPGMDFAVLRKAWPVSHPVTEESMGNMILRLGKVRVLCADEERATGVIMESCDPIYDSDELVPWADIPVPSVAVMPAFPRYCAPTSEPQGYLVTVKDRLDSAGPGAIIHTDLGESSGVQPGDFLALYRDNEDLPKLMIGEALVLTVEKGSCTAKITKSVREARLGDRVSPMSGSGSQRASR